MKSSIVLIATTLITISVVALLFVKNSKKHIMVVEEAKVEKAESFDLENVILDDNEGSVVDSLDNAALKEALIANMKAEIFPVSWIAVGMSVDELREKYPDRTKYWPSPWELQRQDGVSFGTRIKPTQFWSDCTIRVKDGEVTSLLHRKSYRDDDITFANRYVDGVIHDEMQSVNLLFKQLQQVLGPTFERRVMLARGRRSDAVYIWKRENDIVAFSHRPLARWKEDGYRYQISIVTNEEVLRRHFSTTKEILPEDAKIWLDAEDEVYPITPATRRPLP